MDERSRDITVIPRTPTAGAPEPAQDDPVMGLLGAHLPLSLIMDLVMPAGPHSRDLLVAEPADTSWVDDPPDHP